MNTIPAGVDPLPASPERGQASDGHPVPGVGRTCSRLSSRCTGGVARPFRDPIDRHNSTFWLCSGCWKALNHMGAGLVAA